MAAKKQTLPKNTPHGTPQPKRLYRSETDRILGGVCGGLADYLMFDVTIIRIIFAILTVFSGAGLVIYFILWFLIPSQSQVAVISEDTIRHNMYDMRDRARHFTRSFQSGTGDDAKTIQNRRLIGIVIVVVGILLLSNGFGFSFTRFWPLWFVVGGILLIVFH